MSHTNETLHYHLPQYVGTDIINPLVDTNEAYANIDEAIYNVASSAAEAVATANEVKEEIEGTGGVDSRIDALVTRMDAVEAKDVEQDASLLQLNSGLATTNSNVSTLSNNVQTLDGTVAGHTTALGQLNTRVGACENADTALDARVTALEQSPAATVDSAMSGTSENAVQNKVIKTYVDTEVGSVASDVSALETEVEGVKGEVQSANLAIGATTHTFTFADVAIGANTLIDVYTDTFGVNPTGVTYTGTTVTVTFDALVAATKVAVKVANP